MKPIIYMHLIVIVFSAICAYFLFYEKPPQQETYLRINEKAISREDYEKSLKTRPYYQNEAQFLEQFLEKELLIQEAMDKKLHQEEAFTQKVKTFYEKNLVQLLMEKKSTEFAATPLPDHLRARFEACLRKEVRITGGEDVGKIESRPFVFLPDAVKYRFLVSDEKVVRHRKSQGAETLYTLLEQETAPRTGQEMADELENLKNIYLWNQWLEGLKDRAVIEIPGPEKG